MPGVRVRHGGDPPRWGIGEETGDPRGPRAGVSAGGGGGTPGWGIRGDPSGLGAWLGVRGVPGLRRGPGVPGFRGVPRGCG